MKPIGAERALKALETVVDKYGKNHKYKFRNASGDAPSCVYVFRKQPDCLVAKALFECGVPLDLLGQSDGIINDRVDIPLTPKARRILQSAQTQQDAQHTWGEALKDARITAKAAVKRKD